MNNETKKPTALKLENAPCHCNYGSDCCGVFIEVVDGNLICNECGMGIFELMESREFRPENTKEKPRELYEVTASAMKYLNERYHPHAKIIITVDSAEVLSGEVMHFTDEFVKD